MLLVIVFVFVFVFMTVFEQEWMRNSSPIACDENMNLVTAILYSLLWLSNPN